MRTATRVQGLVPVTELQIRKRGIGSLVNGGSSQTGREPVEYPKTSADLTADGSLWYVTIRHNVGKRGVLFQVYDNIAGDDIDVEKTFRKTDTIKLWFSYQYSSFTVVVL